MAERDELIKSLVSIICDYREGSEEPRNAGHVDAWLNQFSKDSQLAIMREMNHVLKRTYFSRQKVIIFLRKILATKDLVGDDPCKFWEGVHLLDIQKGGESQKEMRAVFDTLLENELNIRSIVDDRNASTFIYIDDGIYTGNRVLNDLRSWIDERAPHNAKLHVIANVVHRGGEFYAAGKIREIINSSQKSIKVKWWHAIHFEDRKAYTDVSDVLRPVSLPQDELVQAYVAGMRYQPHFRKPGKTGSLGIFSSDAARQLLENEFLIAGAAIRNMCPHLGDTQRPLGHMTLETLGFGSMAVTFRNCPNNSPLALWAGDPWIPLFPRATNSATAMKRLLENLARDFANG